MSKNYHKIDILQLSEAYIGGPTGENHPGGKRRLGTGGGSDGKTSSVTSIPDELKPLATAYTDKAMGMSDDPFVSYSDPRYADFSAYQNQALGMVPGAVEQSQGINTSANNQLNSTLNGEYLDPASNPYLTDTYNMAATDMTDSYMNSVMPTVNSTFSMAGRYGSNAHQTAVSNANDELAQGLGELGTQIYGGNYSAERDNQMSALGMAPTQAASNYNDPTQLFTAGQLEQDQAQNQLDFNYLQFQDEQYLPYQQLAAMGGIFNSNLGSNTESTTTGSGK